MALTQVKSEGIGDGEVKSADLENSGVEAGTYGSSSAIPAITVDAKGRITSATTSAIDSTSISNGTSNVSVAADANITFNRSGTVRMIVNNTGIDVGGSVTCDGTTSDGDVVPSADSTHDLGTTSVRWANVYADTLYGDGSNLTGVSSQPNGGGSDNIFFENEKTITTSYSIPANTNAGTFGDLTINSAATVTIPSTSTWYAVS